MQGNNLLNFWLTGTAVSSALGIGLQNSQRLVGIGASWHLF